MGQSLYIEVDKIAQPDELMTTSDGKTFSATYSPFSTTGGATKILPYGVLDGLVVSGTTNDDEVAVTVGNVQAADNGSADADGKVAVTSGTVDVSSNRPASGQKKIVAITVDNAQQLAAVAGTDGADFVKTYGAAGGPPLIPVDSTLLAHLALDSDTAAPITAGEIRQSPRGNATQAASRESATFPTYTLKAGVGKIEFSEALEQGHAGPAYRRVVVKGSTPTFGREAKVNNFNPAEITPSGQTSNDSYDGPISSSGTSVGTAGWDVVEMEDGLRDTIVKLAGKTVWSKYYQDDTDEDSYILTQGLVTIDRQFPASRKPTTSVVQTANSASITVVDGEVIE